ncbi:heterogeneous nuclear ribonucleo F [Olea europaea subsp. europaea]|uniref:Heterogeneous nuclear ribonucleo F n=2 Tax=Olea europaea subsp. europaea TaxID=158383 RepID=A0A8S0VAF3_OLEEU|nr:heterogeneous nuclear ribonucleo F [Olea europaea subsp. europaea]
MFYRGKFVDSGDARETGFKRQRLMDQGSSYYGTPPGPSYMYNAPPPPPPAYSYYPPPFPVVRLRGLPFDCTEAEIVDFFHDLDVVDVLFVHKGGKSTGEAYCVLGYPLQIDFALQRNRETIGRRYVEVFQSRKDEYYKAIANEVYDSQGGSSRRGVTRARSFDESKDLAEYTGVLRLRGLPYTASKEDIMEFFKDFVLSESKIHMIANSEGRPTGEAFVEFASAEHSKAAMAKDRMTLKYRYIELFPSSHEELEEAASSGRLLTKSFEGKDMGEPTTVLRMRGLPFSAGKTDIIDFFKNAILSKDSIYITYNFDGRPTGEAFVEFANVDEAKAALAKDRMTLGSRYIELFPASLDELKEATSRG